MELNVKEIIEKMMKETDENGVFKRFGTRYQMVWRVEEIPALCVKCENVIAGVERLANGEKAEGELKEIWDTYLAPTESEGKYNELRDALIEKYGADAFENDEYPEEEGREFLKYDKLVWQEKAARLGGSVNLAARAVTRAWRIYRMIELSAPSILVRNEGLMFVEAMAELAFCTDYEETEQE